MKVTLNDLPSDLRRKMRGPRPPFDFCCDGCSWSPDELGPIDLRPACVWHDWAYRCGGFEKDRKRADREFWLNLQACGLSRWKATVYWRAVRGWGFSSFRYHGMNMPSAAYRWWTRLIGRWVTF